MEAGLTNNKKANALFLNLRIIARVFRKPHAIIKPQGLAETKNEDPNGLRNAYNYYLFSFMFLIEEITGGVTL